MPKPASDHLYGSLDLLVLSAVAAEPAHGYTISNFIRARGGGELPVLDGALYKALHRLEEQGLLEARWGVSANNRTAKYYALTAAGRRQLRARAAAWRRFTAAVERVLAPAGGT